VKKLKFTTTEMWKKLTNQQQSVGSCNLKNACTEPNQFLLHF
jgi:hypothetical protein